MSFPFFLKMIYEKLDQLLDCDKQANSNLFVFDSLPQSLTCMQAKRMRV